MKQATHSLLIRGGRVIDPLARIDAVMDVLLRDGQVAEMRPPTRFALARMKNSTRRGWLSPPDSLIFTCTCANPVRAIKKP